jgi:hypothetical protein
MSDKSIEHRARGLIATKTRWQAWSVNNLGGFRLVDAHTNNVVAGERYDMSAEEVINYCASE